MTVHRLEVKKPPVPAREGYTEIHLIRQATTQNRPANAAKGSTLCPYCQKWLPPYHQEGCPEMPFEIWIAATKARAIAKHGESVVKTWVIQCQHCATPFPSGASKRVHLAGCERRRNAAGLPLNSYPAVVTIPKR